MIFRKAFLTACILTACLVITSCAGLFRPAHIEKNRTDGPLVIMISGKSGKLLYGEFVKRLKGTGYRVILLDGNDFSLVKQKACEADLLTIIKDHSNASPKAVIIGYSLGGAVALSCAGALSENVAGIITYYPATSFIADLDTCIEQLRVPVVVFQGEEDRYFNCCKVETIRHVHENAIKKGRTMELIVYPQAGHGFNLGPLRKDELDMDSWQKTMQALEKFLRRP